jgi:hypothetical protein
LDPQVPQTFENDREALLQWGNLLRQTTPAHVLGIDYLAHEEQRAFYGFDLLNVDRWIEAGNPPAETNAFEFSFDGVTIDTALRNSGYAIEELDGGGTLYSIGEDYKPNLNFPMAVGQLAATNRIVLLQGQMIITRATQDAHNALLAHDGHLPSLAQNAAFVTAGNALYVSDLAEMGELVGVLIQDGTRLADPKFYLVLCQS